MQSKIKLHFQTIFLRIKTRSNGLTGICTSKKSAFRSMLVASLFAFGSPTAMAAFDLTGGNAASGVVIKEATIVLPDTWAPGDAPLIFRALAILGNGWFDAIAPYHPTAVGIYSNIPRRPASERANNYNRNVAILYASYRVLNSLIPAQSARWKRMMVNAGLNPNDNSTNMSSPIGIGNVAGNAVVAARLNDGMNQSGNDGGCVFNCLPYADVTGYKPVNTAHDLVDPSRWQPLITPSRNSFGVFSVQQFVTPQYATTSAYSYTDPNEFTVPVPISSNVNNWSLYKQQADEVLAASAGLTDKQKMLAELFDNKYIGFGSAITYAAGSNGLFSDLDRFVQWYFLANLAAFDTGIAVWQEKYRYDAVRPVTAIRHIYGNNPVSAWGGPGMGTTSMPASQWKSYLNTANHPEYPSGSASFCNAVAEAARLYFGSDTLNLSRDFRRGSSVVEPGVTPSTNISVNFPTWTAWVTECGQSRVNGGVHFQASVDEAPLLAVPIANRAYNFVMQKINGGAPN